MSTEPILDHSILDRLHEWGGDELKLKMIELFLEHAPDRVEGVSMGLENGDTELAERSAHSLKSSAANLGAQAVRLVSGRIEELLERGDSQGARDLLPELETKLGETIQALGTVRRSGSE